MYNTLYLITIWPFAPHFQYTFQQWVHLILTIIMWDGQNRDCYHCFKNEEATVSYKTEPGLNGFPDSQTSEVPPLTTNVETRLKETAKKFCTPQFSYWFNTFYLSESNFHQELFFFNVEVMLNCYLPQIKPPHYHIGLGWRGLPEFVESTPLSPWTLDPNHSGQVSLALEAQG